MSSVKRTTTLVPFARRSSDVEIVDRDTKDTLEERFHDNDVNVTLLVRPEHDSTLSLVWSDAAQFLRNTFPWNEQIEIWARQSPDNPRLNIQDGLGLRLALQGGEQSGDISVFLSIEECRLLAAGTPLPHDGDRDGFDLMPGRDIDLPFPFVEPLEDYLVGPVVFPTTPYQGTYGLPYARIRIPSGGFSEWGVELPEGHPVPPFGFAQITTGSRKQDIAKPINQGLRTPLYAGSTYLLYRAVDALREGGPPNLDPIGLQATLVPKGNAPQGSRTIYRRREKIVVNDEFAPVVADEFVVGKTVVWVKSEADGKQLAAASRYFISKSNQDIEVRHPPICLFVEGGPNEKLTLECDFELLHHFPSEDESSDPKPKVALGWELERDGEVLKERFSEIENIQSIFTLSHTVQKTTVSDPIRGCPRHELLKEAGPRLRFTVEPFHVGPTERS